MQYVTVPAVSRNLHVRLLENQARAAEISDASVYNHVTGEGDWGVICNGVSHNYISDAVKDLGIQDKIRILRLGMTYPLPANLIQDFLRSCQRVLVAEEGEPVMEEAVRRWPRRPA